MNEPGPPHAATGILLLADITGYTAFLETVAEAHPEMTAGGGPVPPAYALMISLLDVVSDGLRATFTPIQTEGDAVFAVADADAVTGRHADVLGTVRATYSAFRARIEEHRIVQEHECQACVLLTSLELKFILHAGTYVMQQLPTRVHVAGPAVNVAHRLLKNGVTESTGLRAYAFVTDAAAELIGLPEASGTSYLERADAGALAATVVDLRSATAA
jgi:hypothetical protein